MTLIYSSPCAMYTRAHVRCSFRCKYTWQSTKILNQNLCISWLCAIWDQQTCKSVKTNTRHKRNFFPWKFAHKLEEWSFVPALLKSEESGLMVMVMYKIWWTNQLYKYDGLTNFTPIAYNSHKFWFSLRSRNSVEHCMITCINTGNRNAHCISVWRLPQKVTDKGKCCPWAQK